MKKSRRTFLQSSALMATAFNFPTALHAQTKTIPIGLIHPVTGALSFAGQQCRLAATMAIDDINAAGGIKSLGGMKLEAILGDAQSRPEVGSAEVERMNTAGVSAIVGSYGSSICLATTQTAAKYNLPHVVDVGVADQIVQRGLKNTFRFGPGYGQFAEVGVANLTALNDAAGKPAKTVMIIHEESLFGTGTAKLLEKELPTHGFEVKEIIKHANPTRDFSNIVLRMKSLNPDIVIPANYYNEYALLIRTMKQQKISPKAIYSIIGGGASSYKFVSEFPDAAEGIIDCNFWYIPTDPRAISLKKRIEEKGLFFTNDIFTTYTAVMLLADAIERAKSKDREAIIAALAVSTFSDHFLPYGPTKFVDGQNTGARASITQVINRDIKLIVPEEYSQHKAIFPLRT